MKSNLKTTFSILFFAMYLPFSAKTYAQSAECTTPSEVKDKTELTSGCKPSSCRGAQTKFGEAKVITELRKELVALKSELELYQPLQFEARTFDIHGIVGETDEQSLDIISKEVQLIEKDFASKLKYSTSAFVLPENKAKQIQFLRERISNLKNSL
ncbi:hypothetical protein [Flagellimonas sp. 2504JD4-2]